MIYFSDFDVGGGGGVDSPFIIVPFQLATSISGSEQVDITSADLAGATPSQCLILLSNSYTGGSTVNSAEITMVGFDGSTAYDINTYSRSGDASTVVARRSHQTAGSAYFHTGNSGHPLNTVSLNSWIADGVRLTLSTGTQFNNLKGIVIFFDPSITVAMGQVALGTGSTVTVSGLGFTPDAVMLFGHNLVMTNINDSFYDFTYGFATASKQRCFSIMESNAQAAQSPRASIRNDCAHIQIASGVVSYTVQCNNFASGSFDLTPSATTGTDDVIYLAFDFGARSVDLVDIDTPTATGSASITGLAFQPSTLFPLISNLETWNATPASSTDVKYSGFGMSFVNAAIEVAVTNRLNAGADPTDTLSTQTNVALAGVSNSSSTAIVASLTSLNSDGATFNYSAVQGTAKKGFALAVG